MLLGYNGIIKKIYIQKERDIVLIDVDLVFTQGFNCFDSALINAINWFNQDYVFIFAETLSLKYVISDNTTIGERIILNDKSKFDSIKKYYDIDISFHEKDATNELLGIIKKEINSKHPVLISFDSYWMPWDHGYQKQHFFYHWCLVVGYDDQQLFILDPHKYLKESKPVSIEYFLNGIGPYITFCKSEKLEKKPMNWSRILKNSLTNVKCDQTSQSLQSALELFAKEIETGQNLELELKANSKKALAEFPIISKINSIAAYRYGFSNILESIYYKYYKNKYLLSLSNDYKSLYSIWTTVKSLLIKLFITRDYSIKYRISKKIREIADYEKQLIISLSEILAQYRQGEQKFQYLNNTYANTDQVLNTHKHTEFINLSPYLNSKAFESDIIENSHTNIMHNGIYYLTEGLPEKLVWNVRGMNFLFPDVNNTTNDNISSCSQIIHVPLNTYKTIMFLAFSVYGPAFENISIEYMNGTKEDIKVGFSRMTASPGFDELVAWRGKGVRNGKIMQVPLHIFAKRFALNSQKQTKCIHLPDCPRLHIFAISLGK